MEYLGILLVLSVLELIYFRIARHYNIVDKPSARGSSSSVTLRGGGIIFYVGAVIHFVLTRGDFPYFFAGLTVVAVVSFVDDIHSLSPRTRLPLQLLGMSLMLFNLMDGGILLSWSNLVILVAGLVVCTGAMNIFNFMDGVNGITGGYALTVLFAMPFALKQADVGGGEYDSLLRLTYVSILAGLVFCYFNFRKRARCFAGDVGSVSIAFIILFLLGKVIVATGDVTWLVMLAVYGVDGCLTIVHRIMLHEDISQPHRKHAYQIMANELHIPHVTVSLLYMMMQAVVNIVFLSTERHWLMFIVSIVVLSVAYCLFMKKYYHLHEETLRASKRERENAGGTV